MSQSRRARRARLAIELRRGGTADRYVDAATASLYRIMSHVPARGTGWAK